MEEREGFEPSRRSHAWQFSRLLPSTTRPPLQVFNFSAKTNRLNLKDYYQKKCVLQQKAVLTKI